MALTLLLHLQTTAGLAAGGSLVKALGTTKRPVIVHIYDTKPAELASYAIDDVSAACRDAGAAAVLVAPELIPAVIEEQEAHRGDYPGPVPVVADCALTDLVGADAEAAATAACGAAAIGIRYYKSDWPEAAALEEALQGAVAAAQQSGLAAILLAEFGADGAEGAAGAGGLASRVGAAAGLGKGGVDTSEGDGSSALELGCWYGSDEDLQVLRDAGYSGLVLKDACRGDVARGARESSPSLAAQRVTALLTRALSKSSRVYGGSMFGSTESLNAPKTQSMESYFDRGGM